MGRQSRNQRHTLQRRNPHTPAQVILTRPCDWTMAPSVASSMLPHGLLMTSPQACLVI